MESSSTKWDLDADEIASITSEDLHDHRPNRWRGPKSSWRTLTEEDRLLWQSIKSLQDQDLAVHLYNTFALKKRGQDAATAQDLTVKMDDGRDAIWAPPKMWTAWPLKERQVPKDQLIKPQNDEDEAFTFRRKEQPLPSTELEEELSATILRTAKVRFRKRQRKMAKVSIEESTPMSGIDTPGISSRENSAKPETEDDGDEDEGAQTDVAASVSRRRRENKTYEPVFSTDDDLSYELLKPSVRHILSQLDTTLTILHNSRISGTNYLSDSSTEDDSDSQSGQRRQRGRPRRKTPGAASPGTPSGSKRGRPRKIRLPRDGETEEEMHLRIARESHRRLPTTPKEEDAAFEEWIRKGDEEIERERSMSLKRETSAEIETEADDEDDGAGMSNVERKRLRLRLRDWSDVLGAAALAGFSSDAIARTTQRCANLFGEGMLLRTLNEVPASQPPAIETSEYRPQPIALSPSSPSPSTDEETILPQRRVASRQASLARSSHSPPSTPRGRRSQTPTAPSSRGSSAGLVFCPMPSCDRAANGFTRKANLRRHMELVHKGQTEEVDSEDEVVGGVHVDGFLKKIVPGRGWRGEDASMRKRKRFYREKMREGDDGETGREEDSSS